MTRRISYDQAYRLAKRVSDALSPTVARLKCVGSVRRRRTTVGDIEFLAEPFMDSDLFGEETPRIEPARRAMLELGTWVQGGDRRMVVTDLFGVPGVKLELYLVHPMTCSNCGRRVGATEETEEIRAVPGVREDLHRREPVPPNHVQLPVPREDERAPRADAAEGDVRDLRGRDDRQALLPQEDVLEEVPRRGDAPEAKDAERARSPHVEGRHGDRRLPPSSSTGPSAIGEEGIRPGAPVGDGATSRPVPGALGVRASSEWGQARQSDRKPGDRDERSASRADHLPPLSPSLQAPLTPFRCRCGSTIANGSSWGVLLGIRTGPANLGKYVVTYCKRHGYRVEAGRATTLDRSEVIPTPTEEDFFALAGVECVPPPQRDAQAIALWNDVNRYRTTETAPR